MWIKIDWNSIWLRAQSHITSHYTWGSVTNKSTLYQVLTYGLARFQHIVTRRGLGWILFCGFSYTLSTLASVGHQWTERTNTRCNQWLALAKIALKVLPAGRNRSLVANTNRCGEGIRATSHTRLRVRAHYTSSTLVGENGRAGPSSLHSTLEGPTEYVNARW